MNIAGFEYFSGPLIDNDLLDESKPYREICVHCVCGKNYRTYVNGDVPIPSVPENVFCPFCELSATNFWMVSGHSGGHFNAAYFHPNVRNEPTNV